MAYSVAICEDNPVESAHLAERVTAWAENRQIGLSLRCFPNAESFLFHYLEDPAFDLLILDVEMGEMDGVMLAKTIRGRNETVQILFVTGYPDYIAAGYDVAALHYLLKPVREEKLFEVLDRAAAARDRAERTLLLPTENGKVRQLVSEIYYGEAFLHTTELHTEAGTYRCNLSISELELLLGPDAVRCHRSYLVLLRHISGISKTELTLDDGSKLPISRSAAAGVHAAFVNYYAGEPT